MKALINITTSAGKSLEGYPSTISSNSSSVYDILDDCSYFADKDRNIQLHKGDKITIEILED